MGDVLNQIGLFGHRNRCYAPLGSLGIAPFPNCPENHIRTVLMLTGWTTKNALRAKRMISFYKIDLSPSKKIRTVRAAVGSCNRSEGDIPSRQKPYLGWKALWNSSKLRP